MIFKTDEIKTKQKNWLFKIIFIDDNSKIPSNIKGLNFIFYLFSWQIGQNGWTKFQKIGRGKRLFEIFDTNSRIFDSAIYFWVPQIS